MRSPLNKIGKGMVLQDKTVEVHYMYIVVDNRQGPFRVAFDLMIVCNW